MDFVLFVVVVAVGAAFVVWYAFAFAATRLFDWVMSPFLSSARRRRRERGEARETADRERFAEFRATVQPRFEAHRRPSHDATSMREYRRLLRVEVREARRRADQRDGQAATRREDES